VIETLTRAILCGELRPGERLVERDIASQLGISKTPVREALMILEHRGLTTSSSFRGAEVTTVDAEFARVVYEARLLVEPAAVVDAVPHHTPASLGAAETALSDAAAAGERGDLAELSLANRRFHRSIYLPCSNPLLRSIADDLQARVALITVAGWRRRSSWSDEYTEHQSILEAVQARNAPRARAEVESHIAKFLAGFEAAPDTAPSA
jgi:DNA-binding GntR family transcriptional regulator